MEADWEFEVGDGAPVIDADWAGLVDLRRQPELAGSLAETGLLPGLAQALRSLNGAGSVVWTSKCDFYPELSAADFDADELDAGDEAADCAAACYIDLLARADGAWGTPELVKAVCAGLCGWLDGVELRRCRVDLVIRRALFSPLRIAAVSSDLGVTGYMTACGGSAEEAKRRLGLALAAFVQAVESHSTLQ